MASILNESTASSFSSDGSTSTTSESMVSMNTEEHDKLYDHRNHTDFLPADSTPMKGNDPKDSAPHFLKTRNSTTQLYTKKSKGNRGRSSVDHERKTSNNELGNKRYKSPFSSPTRATQLGPTGTNKHHSPPHNGHHNAISKTTSLNVVPPHSKLLRSRANSIITIKSARSELSQEHLKKIPSNNDNNNKKHQRSASIDSEASRDSQETEEDVCFPMSPPLHTRINGIDFDELEEFAEQSNKMKTEYMESLATKNTQGENGNGASTSSSISSAALKYTPKKHLNDMEVKSEIFQNSDIHTEVEIEEKYHHHTNDNSGSFSSSNDMPIDLEKQVFPTETVGVSFGNNKIEGEDCSSKSDDIPLGNSRPYEMKNTNENNLNNSGFYCPNRFAFICGESEETVHSPEIATLVKPGQSFAQLFRNGEPTWWLDCSCPTDDEMRCIAKAFGIHPLTAEDIRMQEAREKVELFRSYYFVCFHTFENDKESEEYLEPINVYMVVFSTGVLTFHFAPISHAASVRRRVRQLRDYVDVNADWLCYAMIDDITDSFAPVIQSIEYEADTIEDSVFMNRDIDFSLMLQRIGESRRKIMTLMRLLSGKADVIKMFAKRCNDEMNGIGPALTSQINIANLQASSQYNNKAASSQRIQPRGDIALYLGDIQDHLLTMFQNLSAYEKIFSRSHANYLAQLQVESFNANNKVGEILSKVTVLGTMLVPLNVITGLFGMNVKVPGQDVQNLRWWFSIMAILVFLALAGWLFATFWVKSYEPPTTLNEVADSSGKSIITSFLPRGVRKSRKNSQGNGQQNSRGKPQSFVSLPSKYSRYD